MPSNLTRVKPDEKPEFNGNSLLEAVEVWTPLDSLTERLATGNCPLPECADPQGNFVVYRGFYDDTETFRCEGCGRDGDLHDFLAFIFPESDGLIYSRHTHMEFGENKPDAKTPYQ